MIPDVLLCGISTRARRRPFLRGLGYREPEVTLDAHSLAEICRGTAIDAEGIAVGRVCIDSRRCMPGDVFFALRGRSDGHQYVAAARAAGATLVVVEWGVR